MSWSSVSYYISSTGQKLSWSSVSSYISSTGQKLSWSSVSSYISSTGQKLSWSSVSSYISNTGQKLSWSSVSSYISSTGQKLSWSSVSSYISSTGQKLSWSSVSSYISNTGQKLSWSSVSSYISSTGQKVSWSTRRQSTCVQEPATSLVHYCNVGRPQAPYARRGKPPFPSVLVQAQTTQDLLSAPGLRLIFFNLCAGAATSLCPSCIVTSGVLKSGADTPYLHEYRTYSGISNKEVERKLSAALFPTETACDSQNESDTDSQLVLGTKTVLTLIIIIILMTIEARKAQ